jgi:hypothetical protein
VKDRPSWRAAHSSPARFAATRQGYSCLYGQGGLRSSIFDSSACARIPRELNRLVTSGLVVRDRCGFDAVYAYRPIVCHCFHRRLLAGERRGGR